MSYAVVAVDMTQQQRIGLQRHDLTDTAPSDHRLPTSDGFHYSIPPALAHELEVGQLVWVPFGRERRQGLIVGFDAQTELAPERIRPLEKLADPTPMLRPYQVALARWISDHYLAPLWDTLMLMLPSGVLQGTERVIRLAPTYRQGTTGHSLTLDQRTLVAWLTNQSESGTTFGEITQLYGSQRRARQAVSSLAALGVLREEIVEKRPGVRPRRERFVSLIADPTRIRTRFRNLGRQTKLADLLGWLAEQPERTSRRTEARAAVSATAAHLRELEKRGWAVSEGEMIRLTLDPQRIWPTLLALRGSEVHLTVLEFLARNPTEMTISEVYAATDAKLAHLEALAAEGLIVINDREIVRNPLAGRLFAPDTPPDLTPEQAAACAEIEADIRRDPAGGAGQVFLLHGVTGSGKTEVYLRAVGETMRQDKQAIILVPEIALTPQTVARFGARFGDAIALQHSQLSRGERYDEWRRLRDGQAQVAIGSRSAIFAPLERLGLIVIDEEHEWTYKQEDLPGYHFPHYHAREVAAELAALTGATVILGSATPNVESYTRALRGEYRLLEMTGRVALHRRVQPTTLGPLLRQRSDQAMTLSPTAVEPPEAVGEADPLSGLPPVQIVDLRQELRAGNTSIFSRALQAAIEATLASGHQVVLFLNRRGASTFVMCRDCGWVSTCERCDLPLTYHQGVTSLICHQCNFQALIPTVCSRCMSLRVKHFGVGTQQVELRLHERFPQARIMRWDRDTAHEKGSHERLLTRFAAGQADILIGTQMIAKGLDLPMVTLVGVITADTGLHLPDFRAGERTFQLLTQVAGRAGRSFLGGRVILQTYTPLHYAIQAASHHDYHAFYEREIAFRYEHAYPPVAPLVRLVYSDETPVNAQIAAERLAAELRLRLSRLGLPGTDLVGPAPAFFGKVRNRYRWQLFVRGVHARDLLRGWALPPGWVTDVDPGSVL